MPHHEIEQPTWSVTVIYWDGTTQDFEIEDMKDFGQKMETRIYNTVDSPMKAVLIH